MVTKKPMEICEIMELIIGDTAMITATELAEQCALELNHDEWLDDPNHEIWDIALDIIERYNAGPLDA